MVITTQSFESLISRLFRYTGSRRSRQNSPDLTRPEQLPSSTSTSRIGAHRGKRGTNDDTNERLRQHFANGTDPSIQPPDYLDCDAMQLNRRPRKTRG